MSQIGKQLKKLKIGVQIIQKHAVALSLLLMVVSVFCFIGFTIFMAQFVYVGWIFFGLSLLTGACYIPESEFTKKRKIKTLVKKKISSNFDFTRKYFYGMCRGTLIELFPRSSSELKQMEEILLSEIGLIFMRGFGNDFRRIAKKTFVDLQGLFHVLSEIIPAASHTLERIQKESDHLLEESMNRHLDLIDFNPLEYPLLVENPLFQNCEKNIELFFDERKQDYYKRHLTFLSEYLEERGKKSVQAFSLRKFLTTLRSHKGKPLKLLGGGTLNTSDKALDLLITTLQKYTTGDYLTLLNRVYFLEDEKLKPIIHAFVGILEEFEKKNFAVIHTLVRNDAELLNEMIERYKRYINYRMIKEINIEQLYQSHLQLLQRVQFPDRDERIQEIVKKMEQVEDWTENYQYYLEEFKKLRTGKDDFIYEEYCAIKELLTVLREEKKRYIGMGKKDGARKQAGKIAKIIDDYRGIYNFSSIEQLEMREKGDLEFNI